MLLTLGMFRVLILISYGYTMNLLDVWFVDEILLDSGCRNINMLTLHWSNVDVWFAVLDFCVWFALLCNIGVPFTFFFKGSDGAHDMQLSIIRLLVDQCVSIVHRETRLSHMLRVCRLLVITLVSRDRCIMPEIPRDTGV